MSDALPGPGWWQASDGKWYPPETHPDYQMPPAPQQAAGSGPAAAPTYAPLPTFGGLAASPIQQKPVASLPTCGAAESFPGRAAPPRSIAKRAGTISAAIVLFAGILIGVFVATRTTSTTFQGPPESASGQAVAHAVSLRASDVPSTWSSNDEGGQCIASGQGSDPGAPYCGNAPLPGSDQQAVDNSFANCLGVPVSHISMLTGNDEPGEPFTYSSSTYTAPSNAPPETTAADGTPAAQSYFTLEDSPASQAADLAAFAKPQFVQCAQTWFKNDPLMGLAQGLATAGGVKMAVPPPTIARVSVPITPGVNVLAYEITLTITSAEGQDISTDETVTMGSGRIEVVLNLSGSPATPFPPSLDTTLISNEEQQIAKAAAS